MFGFDLRQGQGGFLDDLHQSLDEFAVPQAEQAQIKAIVARTRADIVV